jgi:hypothetical protein
MKEVQPQDHEHVLAARAVGRFFGANEGHAFD